MIFAISSLLKHTLNSALILLALLGLLQLCAAFKGDTTIQPFRSLQAFAPDLMETRHQSLTGKITDKDSTNSHWETLKHAQALLWAINPEISSWMARLHNEDRILWTEHPTLFNWPVLASYHWQANTFYVGPGFWKLSEADKAAVIAHEYYHFKQNKLGMIGDTVLEILTGKMQEYGSRTEDEAHLYQLYAYKAMDMPPGDIVTGYFRQRGLYRFVLTQAPAKESL